MTATTLTGDPENQDSSSRFKSSRNSTAAGVDKLALSFAVVPSFHTLHLTLEFRHHRFRLNVYDRNAYFEFNPSRIVDPLGIGLASLDDVLRVTQDVWDFVANYVTPVGGLASAKVTRLDLARDFYGVLEPSAFLHAVSVPGRAYQRDSVFYRDGRSGEIKSLRVGGKNNLVRMYRKELESRGLAPDGTIRWECQIRSERLRHYGIETFADITPESIDSIVAERFAWSKAGTDVHMVRDPLSVFDSLGLSASVTAKRFCDHQRMLTTGALPQNPYGRKELSDFISEYGVILDQAIAADGTGRAFTQRLDWETETAIVSPLNFDSECRP